MKKTLLLREPHQVRVLAHPLRMRIIEALRAQEASPKQVAEMLGTKPTRLYHHFSALEEAGLITVTGTRPRRGAVERLYQPTARSFVVDRALFEGRQRRQHGADVTSAASTMFAVTLDELRTGIEAGTIPLTDRERVEVASLRLPLSPRALPRLMRQLRKLLKDFQAAEAHEDGEAVRLTLALFPVGPKQVGPRQSR
ncbi:ArsR/SmtB family transcription factor [Hyalangium gracile]|uniref:ArsR/SmtB family transcription factor n=1 Tax=Hyalangium gracile TaxID=394092 RepID=UPI001CCD82D4|nr:winged helix-turn-helix domain-containing protein [Hyalangium gracile]